MKDPNDPLYIRWPYRDDGDPLPGDCPRCGRELVVRYWDWEIDDLIGPSTRYFYLSCSGFLPTWLTDVFSIGPEKGHWGLVIGAQDPHGYNLTAPDAIARIEETS